jgi:hypothetical protein
LPILAALVVFWIVKQRRHLGQTSINQKSVSHQTQQRPQGKKEMTK